MKDEFEEDTIAAIATAPGPAGVSVVRISGDRSWNIGAKVAQIDDCPRSLAETFRHVRFHAPKNGETIDDGIILFFAAPRSYTGEDVIELQGHGGRIPAERLLAAAIEAGARPAEPGEFTKRAFLNGKLDLSQAEAVMDLIEARTDRAATVAHEQLEGRLSQDIGSLYNDLVTVAADIENLLDFDEDEVPSGFCEKAIGRLETLEGKARELLANWRTGNLLREGALAVISGKPNAGKSSLLNALLGHERAIVSKIPGTTRDSIEELISIDGIPVRLVDTAGLRENSRDIIEAEGIARAGALLKRADLHLRVIDGTLPRNAGEMVRELEGLPKDRTILILNKCDKGRATIELPDGYRSQRLSAVTGEGLDGLRASVAMLLEADTNVASAPEISERHRVLLVAATEQLGKARECLARDAEGLVLAAQRLETAAEQLGKITGRVWSEDLLDSIFSRFCVGK